MYCHLFLVQLVKYLVPVVATSGSATTVTVICNSASETTATAPSTSMDEIQKKWIFEVIANRRLSTEQPVDGNPGTEFDYDNMNASFSFNGCANSLASIENPRQLAPSKRK